MSIRKYLLVQKNVIEEDDRACSVPSISLISINILYISYISSLL